MLRPTHNGERYELTSPTAMPRAAGFLWNQKMMIQLTCRGYAVAQFMQPEPAKYVYAPNLEAKTFMQPEQPYYANHPGRFFYIKDEETDELFSAPYEPCRANLSSYVFSVGQGDLKWTVECLGLRVEMRVSLPTDDVLEMWRIHVKNVSGRSRQISVYPYFPIGYMSWMNQSAEYRTDLQGIVASCVTPYQKVEDYFRHKHFKEKTFFLADTSPTSWETNQEKFEGEGGLHSPSAINREELGKGDARYETPAAIVQYRIALAPNETREFRFILGPAFDDNEMNALREKYLSPGGFEQADEEYKKYLDAGSGCLHIETPDKEFDNFVNHWIARQVFYHGDVNRLTTDPQTRNYLQDNMGMSYLKPQVTRDAFLRALSQQEPTGAMPDGILLFKGAELKYINQVPHMDHCIWLPVCLKAYLDETNDYGVLHEAVTDAEGGNTISAYERISRAMDWLLHARDDRGLNFIAQGDWCDPMNMVGYKGKGVSGWLTLSVAYALNLWADICDELSQPLAADHYRNAATEVNRAVNNYLWDGDWYAYGITDDDVVFGVKKDTEGRIFLNPQSWAILSGAATDEQRQKMIAAIEQQMETPYGVVLNAPAYSAMRDDVGRVTQKFPGSAENGSVYNHAAIFYIYSLYTISENDRAYRLLRRMIPGPDEEDFLQRGQLPVFIPNYYRGAFHEHPRTAGRSSQLFNTGTVSWFYRCLVEGLFGLKGDTKGLLIDPHLPREWNTVKVVRIFRNATFNVTMQRAHADTPVVKVNGEILLQPRVENITAGQVYEVDVLLP
ncbi:MAG TPA: NdvB protein [Bacteroidota bacterium]|nr:NdvB protein [Bacteroidota bacterium]